MNFVGALWTPRSGRTKLATVQSMGFQVRATTAKYPPFSFSHFPPPTTGWGNNEHQRYTDSSENAYVSGGRLIIKAKAKGNDITSARLRTINKFDVRPGYKGFKTIKVSVRLKVPGAGRGMWAAAWMLPTTSNSSCSGCGRYGIWAASGEIDLFESVNDMKEVSTTVHYGGPWPENRSWSSSARVDASQWNEMTILWEKDRIQWYMNGNKVHEAWSGQGSRDGWYSSSNKARGKLTAPFDQNFHILLNLACGGGLTGNVDRGTVLSTLRERGPRTMQVDYVRVYGMR